MASSTSVPMVGCGALALRCVQRASFGTQKTLAARYSSGSSGSAPWAFWAARSACLASKASEMYLRKIRPRTTCLYSAASMLLRSLSAVSQSLASKPMVAEDCAEVVLALGRAMVTDTDAGGLPEEVLHADQRKPLQKGHEIDSKPREQPLYRSRWPANRP